MLKSQNPKKINEFQGRPILAIDYGSKVIGTAKYIPNVDPFPLMLVKMIVKSDELTLKHLQKIIDEESIEVIVVGIPYYTDGKESEQTLKNKKFANLLKEKFLQLEIIEQDETLTTKEAEDRMKNSPQFNFRVDPTQIDCLSAVIILEDFLNS